MKHAISLALATLLLSACSDGPAADSAMDGETTGKEATSEKGTSENAAEPLDVTSTTEGDAKNSEGGVYDPYAEGRPGQPAIPETREDLNWQSRYSPDIPYYNRGNEAIPATMGASPRTALVGQVQPGEGGFIQTCELRSTYCKIVWGPEQKSGYVNMDLLTGVAN